MPMSADPAPAQNEQTQTIPVDTPRQSSLDMHAQSNHQCPLHAQFIDNMVHRSTRYSQSTPIIESPYSPNFMTIGIGDVIARHASWNPGTKRLDRPSPAPIQKHDCIPSLHVFREAVEIHCTPRPRAPEAYITCICTICARGDITLRCGWSLSQFPGSMARTKSHEVGFSYNVSACASPSSLYRVCCSSYRSRCQ